jgi:hypothetical protein
MDTGYVADSGNATLARLRGPITAIRRANPFALVAIDEGGGELARLHRDQGSPQRGNALLVGIDGAGSTVLRRPAPRSTVLRRPVPRSKARKG